MQCDVNPVVDSIKVLDNATAQLKKTLERSSWEDDVKRSYYQFNNLCRKQIECIKDAESKLKNACKTLCMTDVSKLVTEAESLCSAINDV